MKKSNFSINVIFNYFLIMIIFIILLQNKLESETPFEIAKEYANTICRYDMLNEFNNYILHQKTWSKNNKNYDSIAMYHRRLILNSTIDSGLNFKEIQFDLKTKSKLNYFKFTDYKTGLLSKKYIIAIDSTFITYRLANFKENDFDLFYNFELIKDSLNYLKFIKLYYNERIKFWDIYYYDIDSVDKVKAKFDYSYQLTYVDRIGYIHITGNITTLEPYFRKIRYRLYQYDFKFFADRFEENCVLINEQILNK